MVALLNKSVRIRFGTENRIPEYAVLCLYILSVAVMMFYHEPWYDEAQAWLIARDASWHEMLFDIPHYEGHPPFWFLLLAVFAKAGADFDLTLKMLTLSMNAVAIFLLLFYAPFPRPVRLALPFTYFLFYQHGVICRPYALLLIGFFLAAMFWQGKDEKPFRFCFALMLMCASSAYGIIFAGGITIVWLLELRDGKRWKEYIASLFCGRRFVALLSLLIFALLNIAAILPREDTFAASYGLDGDNSLAFRLVYMFFGAIADATCFSAYETYDELRYAKFSDTKVVVGCLLGLALLTLLYFCGRKCRKRRLFFLPFCLFAGFSGIVYFYLQHIDVLFQFLLFWCWVSWQSYLQLPVQSPKRESIRWIRLARYAKCFCRGIVGVCLMISLYWTAAVCCHEVRDSYGFARDLAHYLDTHGLTEYGIMVRWMQHMDEEGNITYINTAQTVNGVALNAYYDRNIVCNMNVIESGQTYATHRIPSAAENEEAVKIWRENGLPAVTLDRCQLIAVFPEYPDLYDRFYTEVAVFPEHHLWKDGSIDSFHRIYVRNDIARKLKLAESETG